MHELSIAQSIIDVAKREAENHRAQTINFIEVEIGELAGVMIDSLTFCYDSIRTHAGLDTTELKIISVPGKGTCLECGAEFHAESLFDPCPKCEAFRTKITGGKNMQIRAINVD